MQYQQVVGLSVIVWAGVLVDGLFLVMLIIVGFLVGNVLVGAIGAVVDYAIHSVLSLCFSLILSIPYQTSHFHHSQFTSFHLQIFLFYLFYLFLFLCAISLPYSYLYFCVV